MAALLVTAMDQGAWGLSTSELDVDATGRHVPSRVADDTEVDLLLDVLRDSGRGVVEMVPALLDAGDPVARLEAIARRCGERGVPLTWTGFTYSQSNPAYTERWIELAHRLADDGVTFLPQLSPRTVDMRLNWDSSMMFMSMPEGWHRVIAAQGTEAKAALLRDPEWRATARDEWDRTEKAMFPHRRPEALRVVEVHGADNQKWLGATFADLLATTDGHPSDVLADFVLANDCRPGPRGPGPGQRRRRRRGPHPRRPGRPDQLVRRRRPRHDDVRLGRHHPAVHPPRARPRRPHPRAGGARAHRPPGRGLRVPRPWRDRPRRRRRPRRVRPRRAPLRRRRVRRRPARWRLAPASPRGRLPGHGRGGHAGAARRRAHRARCPAG